MKNIIEKVKNFFDYVMLIIVGIIILAGIILPFYLVYLIFVTPILTLLAIVCKIIIVIIFLGILGIIIAALTE